MSSQTFNISFPRELVEQIDTIARRQFGSRSDFLRQAALDYIRRERLWEYVLDEGKRIGADAEQLSEEAVAQLVVQRRRAARRVARPASCAGQ
ncbi:MAG: ribbon-helix-helix domain-containing protein [Candidatus Saccharibacteria bacterium]|nr:ribbon-helix-helix domain-containing protein [Candidatus Saccharibacteria bacterium]